VKQRLPRLRRAFTLTEILVVVAVMAVIVVLTVPTLHEMYGDYVIEGAADAVRGSWADARAHAMNESRPYRFAFVPGKGNFRVAPDSADFWNGGDGSAQANDSTPPWVFQEALPRGVRFADGDSPLPPDDGGDTSLASDGVGSEAWVPIVTFLPDGTASQDVEVMFQSRSGRQVVLKLRSMTGSVTTIRPRADGSRP